MRVKPVKKAKPKLCEHGIPEKTTCVACGFADWEKKRTVLLAKARG
jgi:hypothetical protein